MGSQRPYKRRRINDCRPSTPGSPSDFLLVPADYCPRSPNSTEVLTPATPYSSWSTPGASPYLCDGGGRSWLPEGCTSGDGVNKNADAGNGTQWQKPERSSAPVRYVQTPDGVVQVSHRDKARVDVRFVGCTMRSVSVCSCSPRLLTDRTSHNCIRALLCPCKTAGSWFAWIHLVNLHLLKSKNERQSKNWSCSPGSVFSITVRL